MSFAEGHVVTKFSVTQSVPGSPSTRPSLPSSTVLSETRFEPLT